MQFLCTVQVKRRVSHTMCLGRPARTEGHSMGHVIHSFKFVKNASVLVQCCLLYD